MFTPDTVAGLEAAVMLVNSAVEPDTLTSMKELATFYETQGYGSTRHASPAELEEVRAIRPRLRALLSSAGRDDAVELVNAVLSEFRASPRLVRHDALDWHVHAAEDDNPVAVRILVETAMAMVDVIRADEMSRLGVCAVGDCDGLVVDLSRNRSRRYCSTACGNGAAVAAYRARRKA